MNKERDPSPSSADYAGADLANLAQQVQRISLENQRLFRQLVDGEKRFRGLAKAVWRVQEDERRRLALELHDGLGQTLTALKIQLERLAGEARPEQTRWATKLTEAADLAGRSVDETRRLSHLLRPQVLDDLGLIPALRWFTRTLGELTGFEVEMELAVEEQRFDPDIETVVFRVAQEALNNALKHSGATSAELLLSKRRKRLELRVRDHGRGFDLAARPSEGSGHGLSGMRDRVGVFGGHLKIDSRPGKGTTIMIAVPLPDLEDAM